MEIIPDQLVQVYLANYLCESDNRLRLIVKDSDLKPDMKKLILKQKKYMRVFLHRLSLMTSSEEYKQGFASWISKSILRY